MNHEFELDDTFTLKGDLIAVVQLKKYKKSYSDIADGDTINNKYEIFGMSVIHEFLHGYDRRKVGLKVKEII